LVDGFTLKPLAKVQINRVPHGYVVIVLHPSIVHLLMEVRVWMGLDGEGYHEGIKIEWCDDPKI